MEILQAGHVPGAAMIHIETLQRAYYGLVI